MEGEDWSCRRRQICSTRGEDAIEIGNDDAEDAEEIELMLWRHGEDYPPHQQKTGNLGRRSPTSNAVLDFIVEQLLAPNRRAVILAERGGDGVPVPVLKQVPAAKACEPPTH